MKDEQVTLRLPAELARKLEYGARRRRVPKSQLVREALQAYLAQPVVEPTLSAWERVAELVGTLPEAADAHEQDLLRQQIRAHNWRE